MKTEKILEEFERSWDFTRQLTLEYVQSVPDTFWNFSFDPKYGPLNKQFRHMVWVTGLYTSALQDRNLDYSKKKINYAGSTERNELTEALKNCDQPLRNWLKESKDLVLDDFSVSAVGANMGFTEFTHIILQHESNHHGLWSIFAKLAGFSTPKSWQDTWKL